MSVCVGGEGILVKKASKFVGGGDFAGTCAIVIIC